MLRAIGYVRVSTDDQAKNGVSLDAQAAALQHYAAAKEWELVEVTRDDGFSAKNLDRPGIKHVFEIVLTEQIDVLLIHKLDRLTRVVVDLNHILQLLQKHHVSLVSVQESLDATTANGRLSLNLLASVSQWEREKVGERTRDALLHLKAQGLRYTRPGVYGYEDQDGKLVPNKEDQETIATIHSFRTQGVSLNEIAWRLNQQGRPTKRGGRWHGSTVASILRRYPPT